MDFELLTTYMVIPIVIICGVVGIIVKKWIKDVDNKWIPTICAVLGVILALWMHKWVLTTDVLVRGLFSGLASTGVHQLLETTGINNALKALGKTDTEE